MLLSDAPLQCTQTMDWLSGRPWVS